MHTHIHTRTIEDISTTKGIIRVYNENCFDTAILEELLCGFEQKLPKLTLLKLTLIQEARKNGMHNDITEYIR